MQLTEISKSKTPEKFFTSFDEENQTWVETEHIQTETGVRLRRKAKEGWQDVWFDKGFLQLYHIWLDADGIEQEEHVAQGQIFLEYLDWDAGDWAVYPFTAFTTTLEETDGNLWIKTVLNDGTAHLEVEQLWKVGSAKQTYKASYQGQKIRVRAIVKLINEEKAIIDYSDFNLDLVDDQVTNIDGTNFRYLTFASDGQDDSIEVDPYITIDEQSTYIDVACDGYLLNFPISNGYANFFDIYNADKSTKYTTFSGAYYIVDGTTHHLGYDSNSGMPIVIESTVNRVVIEAHIKFDSLAFASEDLLQDGEADANPVKVIIHIYPNRFFLYSEFTINDSIDITGWGHFGYSLSNVTSSIGFFERANEEIETSYGGDNDTNFFGTIADEFSIIGYPVDSNIPGESNLHFSSANNVTFSWRNDPAETITDGTYYQSGVFIIDSAERAIKANPSAGTVNTGIDTSGSYADLAIADDTKWTITEVVGSPGFDVELTFSDLNAIPAMLHINGYYVGNPAHNIHIKIWNNNTSAWDRLTAETTDMPDATADTDYNFDLPATNREYYIDNGIVKIQIYHDSSGSAGHTLYLDEVYLTKLYTSKERLEQGIQYKDQTLPLSYGNPKTTGTGVTAIGSDGFASDGAWHITPDSNDEIKYTVDRIRHKKNDAIHDWPTQSGDPDSPTDYLDEKFLTFDDNAANSTVTADIGNNGNWENVSDGSNRNTNTSGDSVSTDYGTGLDTQNGSGYIDLALGNYLNAFFIKGSVSLRVQPQFAYNDASDQVLFHCYVDANNYLLLFYDAGTDQFHFTVAWGGTSATVTNSAYTSDDDIQIYHLIRVNWDSTTNQIQLIIKNKVVDNGTNNGTPSSSNPTKVTIGAMQDRTLPGDYILISLHSFDTPILPYGAYFTGNGSVIPAVAHKDITFYNSDGTSLDIGTGSYTQVSGNIDNSIGSMSFWFDPVTLSSDTDLYVAGTLFQVEWDDSDNDVVFTYGSVSIRTATTLSSGDNHVKIGWKASEEMTLTVNGVSETPVTASTAPTLDSSMSFNSTLEKIFITDDPNTPQIPCAGSTALHAPIMGDA